VQDSRVRAGSPSRWVLFRDDLRSVASPMLPRWPTGALTSCLPRNCYGCPASSGRSLQL